MVPNGWAQWCLYSPDEEDCEPYVANKLKLFDCLRKLNPNRIKLQDVEILKKM